MTTTELRPCWFDSVRIGPESEPYIPWCCAVLGKFAGQFISTYIGPSGELEAVANRDDEFELRFIPERNPKRDVVDIAKAVYEVLSCYSLGADGDAIYRDGVKLITLWSLDDNSGVYFARAEDALFEVDL